MGNLLADKVALVTGAGRGIGRAIAIAMAGEGAKVALTGRNIQPLDQVADEIQQAGGDATSWQLDVSSENQVEDVVQKISGLWGKIDILVNNAAIIHHDTPVWSTPIEEWDEEMVINLRGTFLCCHYVLPQMVERQEGIEIGRASCRERV